MPATLKRILKCSVAFSIVAAILMIRWLFTSQLRLSQNKLYALETVEPSVQRGLRPMEPSNFCNQPDFKCVNVAITNLNFPICVYEAKDDIYISNALLVGGYFEREWVSKLLDFLRRHPNITFVDLGANLGTYSLPIAHSGIHVVAVEPNKDTARRLAKSVCMGKIEHTIDLFDCALSNGTPNRPMFLKIIPGNRGATYLNAKESCEDCLSTEVTVLNNLIPFIRNKKAVFKVDTEGSEIKIFQEKSAGIFFDQIDVLLIQMEWMHYSPRYEKGEAERYEVDQLLEFFYQRGYDVYDPILEEKLDSKWQSWPNDIIFKKNNLPTNGQYD